MKDKELNFKINNLNNAFTINVGNPHSFLAKKRSELTPPARHIYIY